MHTELRIYNIVIMYLYNKNVLEYYVEIVGSEPKSMIHNNEGRSNI